MLIVCGVFHEPYKEVLLSYLPPELNLPEMEQAQIVGGLTRRSPWLRDVGRRR